MDDKIILSCGLVILSSTSWRFKEEYPLPYPWEIRSQEKVGA